MRYPLTWPDHQNRTPASKRKRSAFKSNGGSVSVAEAMRRLKHEISAFTSIGKGWVIDPEKVVISSNIPLRNDGLPRSGQREPDDPGIAIYFRMSRQDYCFACDLWDRAADNIVAIAKHLEALRGQERWGVGSIEQSFRGYLALPAQTSGAGWWSILGVQSNASREEIQQAYRRLALEHHPDAGGDRAEWDRIIAAYEQTKSRSDR